MKKILLISTISLMTSSMAGAATPWWEQPTICKINPTQCYSNMTMGYFIETGNTETWDATGNCWGLKVICPNALTNGATEATPMTRAEIAQRKNISSDFDIDTLSKFDACFGVRKSNSDGSRVSVNGEYVNVWCNNVLSGSGQNIEDTENGQVIISGTQPTCKSLANDGYIAVVDDRNSCYGKYYDTSEYFMNCTTNLLPDRLIVLNGADYTESANAVTMTPELADQTFEEMYAVSQSQRKKYIKE